MTSESPTVVSMQSNERRSVGVIALISTLRLFGLFALLPVLSLYAADLDNATPILIGLAVGAYGLTQAVLQIPLGALSDRIGRVPVIVGGLAIFALGSVIAAMSDSIHGVIVGRFLQGAGAISAALTALITDATRPEVRTRSMAIYGIGIFFSFALAIVVGPLVAASFGVQALFWIAAVVGLLGMSLLRFLPPITKPVKRESWSLMPALRGDLLRLDGYVFLLHTIMTATFVALPFLLGRKLGIDFADHWKMYLGSLIVSLLIAVPMIMKDERRGRTPLIAVAVGLLLIAEIMLTLLGGSTMLVFAAMVAFFASVNFLEAGLPARLSKLADDEVRGASLGVFASSQFMGVFCGGLVGGRFLGKGVPGDVFFVCALLVGIWLAMHGVGGREKPEKS